MKYAVIEAFSDRPGSGNPAAVCFTERPLPAPLMQRAAAELALPETAFLTPGPDGFGLRWFTPAAEIDLCGHATMAAGYFVMNLLCPALTEVRFRTPAGILPVRKKDGLYEIELPARAPRRIAFPEEARRALGLPPAEAWSSRDLIFVLSGEGAVRGYVPDYGAMSVLTRQWLGVVITAKGKETDFVSRYFCPELAGEDPVTGSAHASLVPLWSERLGKTELTAAQLSPRGGRLLCEAGPAVRLAGKARLVSESGLSL